jgi:ABC-2 type transport system ATP-binding protein
VFPIELDGVTKSYGEVRALDGVSLRVRAGEIHGLLGPNGAGKTTLMRIIAGLVPQDSGEVFIAGLSARDAPRRTRRAVGFVPDSPFLYRYLTGRQYLEFVADLWGLPEDEKIKAVEDGLKRFGLADRAEHVIGSYSFGMRQKLAVAGALLQEPTVLVLDEPLTGFDPPSSRFMKDFLRSFADAGRAVFLSTHILELAHGLCDRVSIISDGRIILERETDGDTSSFERSVLNVIDRSGGSS